MGSYWQDTPPDWYETKKELLGKLRKYAIQSDQIEYLLAEKSNLAKKLKTRELQRNDFQQGMKEATERSHRNEEFVRRKIDDLDKIDKKLRLELHTSIGIAERQGKDLDDLSHKHKLLTVKHAEALRKLDYRKPIRFSDLWDLATRENAILFVVLLLMLICVIASMVATSEIQGRQQLIAIVQSRMNDSQQQIVSSGGETGETTIENDLQDNLQRLYEIRSDASLLIATGADSVSDTVGGLRNRVLNIKTKPNAEPQDGSLWPHFLNIRYHSSDLLLSFVVIVAGCIGAIIAAMRRTNVFTLKDLGLGLGAGLITFLLIRSGKSVFLLNPGGATFILNPYTSAFFGLAAGLFTERAYDLLSELISKLIERLQVAFGISNGNNGPQLAGDVPALTVAAIRSMATDESTVAEPDISPSDSVGGESTPENRSADDETPETSSDDPDSETAEPDQ